MLEYVWSRFSGLGRRCRLEIGNENWNQGMASWFWLEHKRGSYTAAQFLAAMIDLLIGLVDEIDPGRVVFDVYVGGHSHSNYLSGVLAELTGTPDSAGTAFYFGPSPTQRRMWRDNPPTSVQEVLDAGLAVLPLLRARVQANADSIRAFAAERGVEIPVAEYEAGWSFYPPAAIEPVCTAATLDEGMAGVYEAACEVAQGIGIDEIDWFHAPHPAAGTGGAFGHGRTWLGPEFDDVRRRILTGLVAGAGPGLDFRPLGPTSGIGPSHR